MQFAQILSRVTRAAFDAEVLEALAMLSTSPHDCRRFVDALVDSEALLASGECAAVSQTMGVLETIAAESDSVACILMAYLWPLANTLQMHDVCDAIDLWISSCKSAELRQHLQMLAGSHGDANLRRHYEQLVRQGWD